ncbi:TlpA family protein disulfide reductase [Flammeovirga kamogawensis]|uniref:Redoxin domain-containing protein n=1 Tax=Flammeovirga kamogawensis TaxID=373891 RepID=A0ABX8H5I3_9BACT|nr:redoxin domain-containing protein [Flammeovirga kamogawensis]MBB6463558.1 thioredoxin-related protein [Flammeovirga kamogawensis]QWG10612.1 redoxin domain-containing protein [Flammeovirga kamogawensis]TRX63717.1 redoxin domain-containing protein [Flammeovirga kamogawensis]
MHFRIFIIILSLSSCQQNESDFLKNINSLSLIQVSKSNDFNSDKTIYTFFNTTCHYCQIEIKEIKDNSELEFRDISFILISDENIEVLKEFMKSENLVQVNNIKIYKCDEFEFFQTFPASKTPTSWVIENNKCIYRELGWAPVKKLLSKFKE